MNKYQLEGMRARASLGSRRNTNPYAPQSVASAQWLIGYDQMSTHIEETLHNAEEMMATLQMLSRPNPAHVDTKGPEYAMRGPSLAVEENSR